ncbi:MAG: hypothetical protein ACYCTV_05835 [Leptospirales bacterium]
MPKQSRRQPDIIDECLFITVRMFPHFYATAPVFCPIQTKKSGNTLPFPVSAGLSGSNRATHVKLVPEDSINAETLPDRSAPSLP